MNFIIWYVTLGLVLTIINLLICIAEGSLTWNNVPAGIKVAVLGVFLWPIFVYHWVKLTLKL